MKKLLLILGIVPVILLIIGCSWTEDKMGRDNIYEWASEETISEDDSEEAKITDLSMATVSVFDKNQIMLTGNEDDTIVYDGEDLEFYIRVHNPNNKKVSVCMSAMIEGELQPYILEGEDENVYGSTVELEPYGRHDVHIFLNPTSVDIAGSKEINFIANISADIEYEKQLQLLGLDARTVSSIAKIKIKALDESCERIKEERLTVIPAEKSSISSMENGIGMYVKKEDGLRSILEDTVINQGENIYAYIGGYDEELHPGVEEYTILQYVDGALAEVIEGANQIYFKSEQNTSMYFQLNTEGMHGEHYIEFVIFPSKYKAGIQLDGISDYDPYGEYSKIVNIN